MTAPVVLVMAKAPIPGLVKTRLARTEGSARAARLAAAALLDTLDVCEDVFPAGHRFLALNGDLEPASSGALIHRRLLRWTVLPQHGEGLAQRIANAHRDVHRIAGAAVVQIGMDTPHVTATQLRRIAVVVAEVGDPVLGLAADGGWWVLASTSPTDVDGLASVPMSTSNTGAATARLLPAVNLDAAPVLRDVDSAADAHLAAALAPKTRFARAWHGLDSHPERRREPRHHRC